MSAPLSGRFEVATNPAGRLVYTANAVEHPLPGWPAPSAGATVTGLIPAQRKPAGTTQPTPIGARP